MGVHMERKWVTGVTALQQHCLKGAQHTAFVVQTDLQQISGPFSCSGCIRCR